MIVKHISLYCLTTVKVLGSLTSAKHLTQKPKQINYLKCNQTITISIRNSECYSTYGLLIVKKLRSNP